MKNSPMKFFRTYFRNVSAFAEMNKGSEKFAGYYFYRGKPMSKWMLFRLRFALWCMKTFRLFKKPLFLK